MKRGNDHLISLIAGIKAVASNLPLETVAFGRTCASGPRGAAPLASVFSQKSFLQPERRGEAGVSSRWWFVVFELPPNCASKGLIILRSKSLLLFSAPRLSGDPMLRNHLHAF